MTDWQYCPYTLTALKINHFLIAVNYTDLPKVIGEKEKHVLKGHASLETAVDFLKENVTDACKNVIACHLSKENADEGKIMREITAIVPETVNVAIARKGLVLDL